MTGKTLTHNSTWHRLRAFFGIILIFSGLLVSLTLQSIPAFAEMQVRSVAQDNCPAGAKPDSNSILVVLLDRSGSLVPGNGVVTPTDPNLYSSSATKALTDLWPGHIAVIPFGNNQEPIVGSYAHSDSNGINSLKKYIDSNPPNPIANTPLRPAMDQAKTLFSNGIPACSKLVLITDGVPDAPGSASQEVAAIKAQEISWFRNHGLPINVFGLKIDKSTSDGQMADDLLNSIETGTGAGLAYDAVQSAENLGSEVISLYAQWRGLSFTAVKQDTVSNTYPVAIDPSVNQATLISFYEQGVQDSPLTKNGETVPQNGFQQTKDQHYEIDNILDPSQNAGTYSISTVDNKPVSVYSLVDSSLTLQLVSPTATTIAYTGQKLPVQARFLNGGTPDITGSASPLTATVKLSLNGSPPQERTGLLFPEQGSDLYTGYYLIPTTGQKQGKTAVEVGTLSISVVGTASFQGTSASRGTSTTTIQVDVPKAPPVPPKPPVPCRAGPVKCFLIQYHTQILIAIPSIIVLLLALFLLWWIFSNPFVGSVRKIEAVVPAKKGSSIPIPGYTLYPQDITPVVTVHLGEKRTVMNKLLHRRVINSVELHQISKRKLYFNGASFQLIAGYASPDDPSKGKAQKGRQRVVFIKPISSAIPIVIKRAEQITPAPQVLKTSTYGGDTGIAMKSGPSSTEGLSVTTPTQLAKGDIVRIDGQDNFLYS